MGVAIAGVAIALGTNACRSHSSTAPRASSASDASVAPMRSALPLQMRMVAKQSVYHLGPEVALLQEELARQGRLRAAPRPRDKSPRERLKDQLEQSEGRYPEPPAVDLVLEIANVSQQPVEFWSSGDAVQVDLEINGPEVVRVNPGHLHTMEFRMPEATRLAPGEIHRRPITRLAHGDRDDGEWDYWTEPGQYTIAASLRTGLHPPPAGMSVAHDDAWGDYARVVLGAPPISIEVAPTR
jgi:hypothetical protein